MREDKKKRGKCRTTNWAQYNAALKARGSRAVWLDQDMRWAWCMSLLKLAQLDWPVPDCSTDCRRQKTLRVQRTHRPSAQPLHLLRDSTGIKFLGEGECKRRQHGAEYRRVRCKIHLGIDAQTLEIRAIGVTRDAL